MYCAYYIPTARVLWREYQNLPVYQLCTFNLLLSHLIHWILGSKISIIIQKVLWFSWGDGLWTKKT